MAVHKRCPHGLDRTLWQDLPQEYPGAWIVTKCRRCGGIVGRRPPESDKRSRQPRHEDAGHVVNVAETDQSGLFED